MRRKIRIMGAASQLLMGLSLLLLPACKTHVNKVYRSEGNGKRSVISSYDKIRAPFSGMIVEVNLPDSSLTLYDRQEMQTSIVFGALSDIYVAKDQIVRKGQALGLAAPYHGRYKFSARVRRDPYLPIIDFCELLNRRGECVELER